MEDAELEQVRLDVICCTSNFPRQSGSERCDGALTLCTAEIAAAIREVNQQDSQRCEKYKTDSPG